MKCFQTVIELLKNDVPDQWKKLRYNCFEKWIYDINTLYNATPIIFCTFHSFSLFSELTKL